MKKLFLLLFFVYCASAKVREYCPDTDHNAVLSIIASAFDALSDGPEHAQAQDIINEYFNIPGSKTFVWEKGNFIYGFINFLQQNPLLLDQDKDKKIGLITLIAVAPGCRNNGLGKELITFSLDWFAKRAIKKVSLYVHKNNDAAQRFYKRMGFVLLSDPNDPLVQGFKGNPCSITDDIFLIDLPFL